MFRPLNGHPQADKGYRVLVDGTCLIGCKFEGAHPVDYRELFIDLYRQYTTYAKTRCISTTGLYLATFDK